MDNLTQIGRYAVKESIGVGGFAEVWRAWDEEFDIMVAIKVLSAEMAGDSDLADRFVSEARMLRRVNHPNVVAVRDLGHLDDGRPYFVLDFARQGTLAGRLSSAPCADPALLMPVISGLADGLSALHEEGIVHRDIKPANLLINGTTDRLVPAAPTRIAAKGELLADDETLLIGDLGLAKDLALGDQASVLGGTPGYQAPEQRTGEGAVSTPTDIYGASAVIYRVLVGQDYGGGEIADAFDDAKWFSFFDRSLSADPDRRHRTIAEWRASLVELVDSGEQGRSVTSADPAWRSIECPYKGLAAFQPEDRDRFHGRDDLIDLLGRRLKDNRVLVVGGPSGSGKSSVVRAGLIPKLRERPGARVLLMTPGHEPLEELSYQLSTLGDRIIGPDAAAICAQPRILRKLLEESLSNGEELVLVIDQFEELFTHIDDPQLRDAFIAAIDALVSDAQSSARIVIAIRADFYATSAHSTVLARWISDNQVLVGPMTTEELKLAIVEPAHQVGVSLEAGLAERVLHDAGTQQGALPLVSHALLETWRHRSHQQLRIADYESVGGVSGAISITAETLYQDKFDSAQRRATRRLLLRLVTPGEGAADTRRRLSLDEIDRDVEPVVQRGVVDALSAARLLTVHDDHIEIAHEALLGTWPRLSTWIDEERENLRHRQRVSRAAAQWNSSDRDPDLLYRGTPLTVSLDWADSNDEHLDSLERTFLAESRRARDDAQKAEQARSRAARRARIVGVTALALLAVAALAASVIAFGALDDARQNEQTAAERFGAALGSQALATANSDPLLAINLGLESAARSDPPDINARAALLEARKALSSSPVIPVGAPIPVGKALTVTLAPNGSTVAVGGDDGVIQLWDLLTRDPIGQAQTAHTGGVNEIIFSADGSMMFSVAAGSDGGEIFGWPVQDAGLGDHFVFETDAAQMWSVDITADDKSIVTSSENGLVEVWDVGSQERLGAPLENRFTTPIEGAALSSVNVVSFAADDSVVITGDDSGFLFGWSWPSRELLFGPVGVQDGNEVFELVVDDDGTVLTGGSNGSIEHTTLDALLELAPGSRIESQESLGFAGIQYDAESGLELAGTGDGTVVATATGTTYVSPSIHTAPVVDSTLAHSTLVTLSKDQTMLVWSTDAEVTAPEASTVVVSHDAPIRSLGVVADGDGVRIHGVDEDGESLVQTSLPTLEDISTSGQEVFALSQDGQVGRILDGVTFEAIDADAGDAAVTIASSDDASTIAIGSDDGAIQLFDAADGASLGEPSPFSSTEIVALSFIPETRDLVAGSFDGKVAVIDEGAESPSFVIETGAALRDLAVNPEGEMVAVAREEGDVRQFDLSDGQAFGNTLLGADGEVWSVLYLGDGDTLAGGDKKATVHFWDSATGVRIDSFTHHLSDEGKSSNPVYDLVTDPHSSEAFYSAGSDGDVRYWDVLDSAVACSMARPSFDDAQRAMNLGEGVTVLSCRS